MMMEQFLVLLLLVGLIQQSPGQVFISSSASNESSVEKPSGPVRSSPTVVSPEPSGRTLQSPPSPPLNGRKAAPVTEHAEGSPVADGHLESHGGNDTDLTDTEDGGEERKDSEDLSSLPQDNTSTQDDNVQAFISPASSQTETTLKQSVGLTTAAYSLPPPASSTSGTGLTQAHSDGNAGQPVIGPTGAASTNDSSHHIRSHSFTAAAAVREEVVTLSKATEGPNKKAEDDDWQLMGSGDWPVPTVSETVSSAVTVTTHGDAQAYHQPQSETRYTTGFTNVLKPPTSTVALTQELQSLPSTLSPANTMPSKRSPELQSTVYMMTANTTMKQSTVSGDRTGKGETTNHRASDRKLTGRQTTTVTSMTPLTTVLSTTNQKTETEKTTSPIPTIPQKKSGRGFGLREEVAVEKNRSVSLGRPPSFSPGASPAPSPVGPCAPGSGPCVVPSASNGTALLWGDLRRTLAFAWELHVYGTAGLFLLLAGGALLGLLLSPGLHCPHRGCLALANALLLLAGALRATHFFLDPYGSREILPQPGVTALYNLPLALLLWAQVALGLLALKGAGLTLLPPGLQRLPLAAVLAVLHCTLLLAADLLSPALSPAVPVVLQTLSLSWGLAVCLGFLFYAFPRLRRHPAPPVPEEPLPRGEDWQGGQRVGRILGRVLAVCACLGALCCGLHVHATLWLYGLLGDWRRFSWVWWLVHFWARLLELAWAFSLLLLASWVFWRPRDRRGAQGAAEGRAGADLPSSSSSSASMQRHTCWAKIVQSLRGRPCRKSESNGIGGGGAGELPNNWAGQERPGADISKSLIRNRDPPALSRSVKDSNRGRNQKGGASGSVGSLLRLHSLGRPPQRSLSSSLDREKEWAREKESILSLNDFDLRPPSPIDLSRSIDEALHREHLLGGGSLFRPLCPPSPPSPGPRRQPLSSWPRRSSDPQINLSDGPGGLPQQHAGRTETAAPPGGSVTGKQATAPATPTHLGCRFPDDQDKASSSSIPSSVSCPISIRPSRTPVQLRTPTGEDTRPFLTPDSETEAAAPDVEKGAGSSFLEVSRQEDSASVSSDIIDL
ncbi:proline-rich transmembrane protein 3 [Megalops cyprinoides]|uniref:proline-rich transmembrane protein 3 n=1 Tax=Megalops cyprinoides TaxID=118141 RepID=UPI0018653A4D|nr:proline-rich transmembrane protein 3 [Megalops cyprinoides]